MKKAEWIEELLYRKRVRLNERCLTVLLRVEAIVLKFGFDSPICRQTIIRNRKTYQAAKDARVEWEQLPWAVRHKGAIRRRDGGTEPKRAYP